MNELREKIDGIVEKGFGTRLESYLGERWVESMKLEIIDAFIAALPAKVDTKGTRVGAGYNMALVDMLDTLTNAKENK